MTAVGKRAQPLTDRAKEQSHKGQRRKERWSNETDPFRAKVLYQLAALGYEARTGRMPRPSDLNREYPASPSSGRPHGAWNDIRQGKHLPRPAHTPQGMLMRALRTKDPVAAASYDWPLWPLASNAYMTLPELHARMLELDPGVRHMLVGSFINGRYLRWPTDPRREIEWMRTERSIHGLAAVLAILRESELVQDRGTYADAYLAMCDLLPALYRNPGTAVVAAEFGAYIVDRFAVMNYIVPGAYEQHPTSGEQRPVMIKLDVLTQEAINEFEQNWKKSDRSADGSEDR